MASMDSEALPETVSAELPPPGSPSPDLGTDVQEALQIEEKTEEMSQEAIFWQAANERFTRMGFPVAFKDVEKTFCRLWSEHSRLSLTDKALSFPTNKKLTEKPYGFLRVRVHMAFLACMMRKLAHLQVATLQARPSVQELLQFKETDEWQGCLKEICRSSGDRKMLDDYAAEMWRFDVVLRIVSQVYEPNAMAQTVLTQAILQLIGVEEPVNNSGRMDDIVAVVRKAYMHLRWGIEYSSHKHGQVAATQNYRESLRQYLVKRHKFKPKKRARMYFDKNGGGAGDPVSDPDEQSSKRPRVEGEEEVVDETSPQVSAAAARVYQLSRRADLLPGAGLPPELSTALALSNIFGRGLHHGAVYPYHFASPSSRAFQPTPVYESFQNTLFRALSRDT